ncbi:hypothetical protein L204_103662 [Cryptococcus depauperatus]|nr:hypothetical protein L204_01979 [Cryptococcus depauperatus CBS 7855]
MTMFKVKSGLIVPSLMLVAAFLAEPIYAVNQGDKGSALYFAKRLAQQESPVVSTKGVMAAKSILARDDPSSIPTTSQTTSNSDKITAAPSSASTNNMPLASSLATLANPYGSCIGSGGGCAAFLSSISKCSDDACACGLSFPAQQCAQCMASQDAVDVYNAYLKSCVNVGLAKPTSTVTVEVSNRPDVSSSKVVAVQTDGVSGSANSTGSGGSASRTATGVTKSTGLDGVMALATDSTSGAAGSTASSTLSDTATNSKKPVPTSGSTNMALDSAHQFFKTDVNTTCTNKCQQWQKLAQTCTDDNCICTSDGLSAASSCSSCIGSSQASDKDKMRAYASYRSNCTLPVSGSESDTSTSSGGLGFSTSHTSSTKTNPFGTGPTPINTVGAVEANGEATTVLVHSAAARRVGLPLRDSLVGVLVTLVALTAGLII